MLRKVTILVVLFLGLVIQASAQQQMLIGNPAGRNATSLNGNWQIIIDPYETGYYDYRYQPRPDGYFKNQKPATPGDLVEYDFDSSQQLLVPGDWNSQDDKLLFYEGTIWYKKTFNYQKKDHSRLFVYFGGANYLSDVYLNGEKLGRHEGGFRKAKVGRGCSCLAARNFGTIRHRQPLETPWRTRS